MARFNSAITAAFSVSSRSGVVGTYRGMLTENGPKRPVGYLPIGAGWSIDATVWVALYLCRRDSRISENLSRRSIKTSRERNV